MQFFYIWDSFICWNRAKSSWEMQIAQKKLHTFSILYFILLMIIELDGNEVTRNVIRRYLQGVSHKQILSTTEKLHFDQVLSFV